MCGETEFSGMLVERFAGYHRQSYGGCKVGVGDVLIGAAALAADYNGAAKASHVKDKLIEMTHLNETLYACGIACSAQGCRTASGTYLIDLLLANVCKQNVTRFPYEIARLAEDIAGGLMVTMPSEKDLDNPATAQVVRKILPGRGRRAHRSAHAHPAPDREPHPGHRRRGLPHRVHARRRLAPGPAHHDRPPGRAGRQEGAGPGHRRHPGPRAGLTSGLQLAQPLRLVGRPQRLHDGLDHALHERVQLVDGDVHPVVGDPALGEVVGADLLAAVAGAHLGLAQVRLQGVLLARLILQAYKNFRYEEDLQGILNLIGKFQMEYEKFGESIQKIGRSLEVAQKTYNEVEGTRSRALTRVVDKISEHSQGQLQAVDKTALEPPSTDSE